MSQLKRNGGLRWLSERGRMDWARSLQGSHGFVRRRQGVLQRTDNDSFGCPHKGCHEWFSTEQAARLHFKQAHSQAVVTVRVPRQWRPPWAQA